MTHTIHVTKDGHYVRVLTEQWAWAQLAGRTYLTATRANRRLRQRALLLGADYRAPYLTLPDLKRRGHIKKKLAR